MSVTLNGTTYLNSQFADLGYVALFPEQVMGDFLAEAQNQKNEFATASNTTSTTSLAVGTGSKAFVVATALNYPVGAYYIAADASNPTTNIMLGQVSAWNSGTSTLTLNVTYTAGSGTIANWVLSYSAPQGATGAAGTNGAAGTSAQISDVAAMSLGMYQNFGSWGA